MKLPGTRKEWRGFQIGPFWFHRLEQWDKDNYIPFLCIHLKRADSTRRVFCI